MPALYPLWYIIPALLGMGLTIYGLRGNHDAVAIPFSLLTAALTVWCLCHALSVAATTFAATLFWAQLQYAGIAAVGPFWLLFALAHTGREQLVRQPVRVAIAAVAILTFVAAVTNTSHYLWWSAVSLDTTRPFGSLALVRGPLFWLHTILSYTYLLIGIGLFVQRALSASQFYQRQAGLIIIAVLIPLLGNIALLLGLRLTFADDPTPVLLLFSTSLLFYTSRHYDFLNLVPIAQRVVFESMPDGVIVLNQQGIVNSVNNSARQFLPPYAHELTGEPVEHLLNGSPLATDVAHMLTNSTQPQTRRVRYSHAAALHCVEVRLQPLFTDERAHAGSLLLLRDLSEQVRAEHARDQRLGEVLLLQQIARAANSALETDAVLRVISREMLRALPWHRVVVGLLQPDATTLRLIADQNVQGEATLDGRFIDVQNFDLVIDLMRAGRPRVLHINDPLLASTATQAALRQMGMQTVLFLPLLDREQPLGMLFVGSLGERQIADDELRMFEPIGKLVSDTILRTQLYEAAQEANSLKSAFLATVSHELRTPLTSVIGYADMLQTGVFGPLPDPITDAVDSIQRGSYVLLRLINDILDFSKMEAGHFAIDVYPVEVNLVIQLAAKTLQPQLHARGLTLALHVPPSLPLIQANSTRLEQVLINLLANAIKFTEVGQITIRATEVGPRVRISVHDTGIGIPSEFQTSIFDAFRQVENPLTRRYGGTGLGLAIVRRLIDLMGGTISVESEPGAGSSFHCEFHAAFDATHEYTNPTFEPEKDARS